MKIGIITITDYTNYGNRLQNYAVCRVLKDRFGYKAVTLTPYRNKRFYNGSYIAWVKECIVGMLCVFPRLVEKRFGCGITRWANFRSWSRRNISMKNYYGCRRLPESLNRKYDLFFAGSDQIWNYGFSAWRFDDYFLTFAEPGKRAAISASFGVEEIPEKWKQRYIDGLSGLDHISVREDAGARIIRQLLGREVPVLIDPVMLLGREEWLKVAHKPRVDCSKPYILKYYLGDEAEEEKIDRWAEQNGYRVYELMNDSIPQLYSAGPGEFISLIANASLVCSDSFHCIAFSIIFGKPFVVYARRGKEDNMTSRLDTLLRKFNFEGRWKQRLTPEQYLNCDFTHVDGIMKTEQEKALDYIKMVIEQTKTE